MSKDISDLYIQYYNDIYRYIYSYTLNKYDTEDILHNTFVKVMKGIHTFKNKSDIKTWLLTIAHNECMNFFDKNKNIKLNIESIDKILLTVEDDIEKKILYKEEAEQIIHFIQIQKEPVKTLLILRLVNEESFENISIIINKSLVWCRVNFFRSKKKIIESLEEFRGVKK